MTTAAYLIELLQRAGCLIQGATWQDSVHFWIKSAPEDGLEIPQPGERLVYA